MLGLGKEFGNDEFGGSRSVGDDQHFRRTGKPVDTDDSVELTLRLGHVGIARTDDLVDCGDARRAESGGGDRLRTTDGIEFVDLAETRGKEYRRMHASVALRGRQDDPTPNPGDLRRNRSHKHRGWKGRASTRCVDRYRSKRLVPERIGRSIGAAIGNIVGPLPAVEIRDALGGKLDRRGDIFLQRRACDRRHRNRHAQMRQAILGGVESTRIIENRPIASRFHVGDDFGNTRRKRSIGPPASAEHRGHGDSIVRLDESHEATLRCKRSQSSESRAYLLR